MAKAAVAIASIHGIPADKLNENTLDAALRKLGVTMKEGATLEKKVKTLKKEFEKVDEEAQGPCDNCGGVSPIDDYEVCPFCGVGDEDTTTDDASEEDGPESHDTDAPPPEAFDPETGEIVHEATPVPKPEPAPMQALGAPELDKEVAAIRAIQQGTAAGAWMLAQKLAELKKNELWKQRRTAEGKVSFKTFDQFTRAELDMSKKYANLLVRLRERFEEAEFVKFGTTKLQLVLTAPANSELERDLLGKLEKGAGRREIEKKIGRKGIHTEGAKGKKASEKAAASSGLITFAMKPGKQTIKMYRKPVGANPEMLPVKRLADMPWACLQLENDVEVYFLVKQNPSGELLLQIEPKRAKSE